MEFEKIVELIRVIEESDMAEFQMQDRDFQISMKRYAQNTDAVCHAPSRETFREVKEEEKCEQAGNGHVIKSSLVGIFHASESEGMEAFAALGDKVEKGQVLGTIEAMKMMNEVLSACSGRVAEVLVKDGQLVEYGQPLFVIEE